MATAVRGRRKSVRRSSSGRGGVLTFWGIGYNQMLHGQHNTISIINLHLLTGNVGRQGLGEAVGGILGLNAELYRLGGFRLRFAADLG